MFKPSGEIILTLNELNSDFVVVPYHGFIKDVSLWFCDAKLEL